MKSRRARSRPEFSRSGPRGTVGTFRRSCGRGAGGLQAAGGALLCIFPPSPCLAQGPGVTSEKCLCVGLTEPLTLQPAVVAPRQCSIDAFIVAAYHTLKFGGLWTRKMFTVVGRPLSPRTVSCHFKSHPWWAGWVSQASWGVSLTSVTTWTLFRITGR